MAIRRLVRAGQRQVLAVGVVALAFLTPTPGTGQDLGGLVTPNGDFEAGDLGGWTLVSGQGWDVHSFDQPNKQGAYFATTCDEIWPGDGGCKNSSGEADVGVLISQTFELKGDFIHFRLAGHRGRSCEGELNRVRLRRAGDHEALRETPAPCANAFTRASWDVRDLQGESVYIQVEDGDAASGWAWLAVDDFRYGAAEQARPPEPEGFELAAEFGQITFTSRRGGGEAIYTLSADGSALIPMTRVQWKAFSPAWSPDGRSLAFVSNRGSANAEVFILDFMGLWQVTDHPAYDHHPTWAPDGRRLVFVSNRSGESDLFEIGTDGSGLRPLTEGLTAANPHWSPTGRLVAFAAGGDILTVEPATGTLDTLSAGPAWEGYPAWSPDGGRLAWVADGELVVGIPGSSVVSPLTHGYAQVTGPAWSPDGTVLAFASTRESNEEIYLCEVSTGRINRLTREVADDFEPGWYPGPVPLVPTITAVEEEGEVLPGATRLEANYPNPFNGGTVVRYTLGSPGFVRLSVYDLLGQRLATLAAGHEEAGGHQVVWDGTDRGGLPVATGTYVLRLEAGASTHHRSVVLLR